MGEEIREPRRVIPRSLFVAGFILAVGYIAGTLSLLVALPAESINGLSGFMTAIDLLARHIGLPAMVAPIAVLVAISNIGAASAYLSATARLPFVAGVHRYLPAAFGRVHPRFSTPYVALISYRAAGILFGLLGQAGASVRGAYDMLVAMAVITYFIPYLFLFASRGPHAVATAAACVVPSAGRQAHHYCTSVHRASIHRLHHRSIALSCGGRLASRPDPFQSCDHDACAADRRRCNLSFKPPRAATRYRPSMKREVAAFPFG